MSETRKQRAVESIQEAVQSGIPVKLTVVAETRIDVRQGLSLVIAEAVAQGWLLLLISDGTWLPQGVDLVRDFSIADETLMRVRDTLDANAHRYDLILIDLPPEFRVEDLGYEEDYDGRAYNTGIIVMPRSIDPSSVVFGLVGEKEGDYIYGDLVHI